MTPNELRDMLAGVQEPKGYFFNTDEKMVLALMESLLVNRERYGYMACPCRLAADDREWDRDIICPCVYREEDVAGYGSCYCGLYISEAMKNSGEKPGYVPERRPPDKSFKF